MMLSWILLLPRVLSTPRILYTSSIAIFACKSCWASSRLLGEWSRLSWGLCLHMSPIRPAQLVRKLLPQLSLLHSPNNLLLAQQDLQAKIAMLEVYKILGVLKTQGNSKTQDNILGTCNITSPLPHSQHPRCQMAEMDEVLLKT